MMSPIQPTPSPNATKPLSLPPSASATPEPPSPPAAGIELGDTTTTIHEPSSPPAASPAVIDVKPVGGPDDAPNEVDPTIRVVGGGGSYTSGLVKEAQEDEGEDVATGGETTETESIVDGNGVSKKVKKKGFGLKKLGLGGKRKKDSVA